MVYVTHQWQIMDALEEDEKRGVCSAIHPITPPLTSSPRLRGGAEPAVTSLTTVF